MAINDSSINNSAINDVADAAVFFSTDPTVTPTSVTVLGTEGTRQTLAAAQNLFQQAANYSSVVVDINAPQTPKSGTF